MSGGVNLLLVAVLAAAIAIVLMVTTLIFFRKSRLLEKEKSNLGNRLADLEGKINSLELENIRYKLNPHLFKNALNSIQSHAYQTYYSLDKLSRVLDFILYESDRQFVSVREELDFALSLIEINRIKLGPLFDLRVKNKVAETSAFFNQDLLAPLITVDLIENAFKHGSLREEADFISIAFELGDEFFRLTVSNRVARNPASAERPGGFGMNTLRKRLEILYGENYKLETFTENEVFVADLKINLLEHKAKMLAIG